MLLRGWAPTLLKEKKEDPLPRTIGVGAASYKEFQERKSNKKIENKIHKLTNISSKLGKEGKNFCFATYQQKAKERSIEEREKKTKKIECEKKIQALNKYSDEKEMGGKKIFDWKEQVETNKSMHF